MEEAFSGSAVEGETREDTLKERVTSYIAEAEYQNGVHSLEAAFDASLHERARQLEVEQHMSSEHALAEARKEFDEAYEKVRSRA